MCSVMTWFSGLQQSIQLAWIVSVTVILWSTMKVLGGIFDGLLVTMTSNPKESPPPKIVGRGK